MERRVKGLKATNLFKKITPDIRWCDNCGVPLIAQSICPLCSSKTRRIKVVPPGDIRPAFEYDKQMLKEIIAEYVGIKAVHKFISFNDFILLNKVQAIDSADEVIVSGYSIGIREFDIYKKKWIFKPGYIGVKIVVDEGLGFYAILNKDNLKPYTVISRSDILEGEIPPSGYWVSISSKNFAMSSSLHPSLNLSLMNFLTS